MNLLLFIYIGRKCINYLINNIIREKKYQTINFNNIITAWWSYTKHCVKPSAPTRNTNCAAAFVPKTNLILLQHSKYICGGEYVYT